jgi:hypothetical protein
MQAKTCSSLFVFEQDDKKFNMYMLRKDTVLRANLCKEIYKEFRWSLYVFAAGAWLSLSAHSIEGFFKQSSKECLKFFFVNSGVSNAFAG